MPINRSEFQHDLRIIKGFGVEDVITAYNTFHSSGEDEVISKDILKSSSVKDYLILSDEMERYLDNIKLDIKRLVDFPGNQSLAYFYYAQFGGSKSQFRALVHDELLHFQKQDRNFPSNKLIFLKFPKIGNITSTNIFDQLTAGCLRALARDLDDEKKFYDRFIQIKRIMLEIQLGLLGINKRAEILKKLDAIQNGDKRLGDDIESVKKDLNYIQFMNDEVVIEKCVEIIKIMAQENFIFFWLFDEIDQWFDVDTGSLSTKFMLISRMMQRIFYLGKESKTVFLFLVSPRVQDLLDDPKISEELQDTDAAIDRFFVLYRDAEPQVEFGHYGEKIDEAITKFAQLKCIEQGKDYPEPVYYDFLDEMISFFRESNWHRIHRRKTNSEILNILNEYYKIEDLFTNGFKRLQRKNWIDLGNLIPDKLPSILRSLAIPHIFYRGEEKIEPDNPRSKKVDGKFVTTITGRSPIYVECKMGQKGVEGLKIDQVLKAVRTFKTWIIFIVFGNYSKKEISARFVNELTKTAEVELEDFIKVIVVKNLLAFAPIIGIEKDSLTNKDIANRVYKACGFFLKKFSKFTIDLSAIFIKHQKAFPKEYKDEYEEDFQETPVSKEEINEKETFKQTVENDLESIDQLIVEFLCFMKKKNAFTKTGAKRIDTIKKILEKDSTGLVGNLDEIQKRMESNDLKFLNRTTKTQWKFASVIYEKGVDKSITTNIFRSHIVNEIINHKKAGLQTFL